MKTEEQQIVDQIEVLDNRIHELQGNRHVLNQRLMSLRSQFQLGDVIEWVSGKSKSRGRVEFVGEWCFGKPQWRVVNLKKDGTEGSSRWIRYYMKPTLVTPSSPTNLV